ncbi:MAG: hypothetical protein ACFFD4_21765 [Candidatus Odinarchaeota archaeon]
MKSTWKFRTGFIIILFSIAMIPYITIPSVAVIDNGFNTQNYPVVAFVDDAFYADLDGLGNTFDIQFNVSVHVLDFEEAYYYSGFHVLLRAGLELPSGAIYWYDLDIIAYKPDFKIVLQFYNYCLESGIYTAHILASTLGSEEIFGHLRVFDPPGGVGGAPPSFKAFLCLV